MARYTAAVRALVEHLIDTHDHDVLFISTCQGVADYWTDDSDVALSVVEGLASRYRSRVDVDDQHHDPQELMGILRHCELVVSTRLHMGILSLNAGTPVVGIAYEFKTAELFEALGLGQWVMQIETLTSTLLNQMVSKILEELPSVKSHILSTVPMAKLSSESAVAILREAACSRDARCVT